MQIDKQQQGRSTRLRIGGELTIYDAVELQRTLLESLSACESLELDLRAVTELDTAGLQQLVLLRREANAAGKALRIEHGEATRDVLALCRLDTFFSDPEPASARRPSAGAAEARP